jgi:hypothetical protein
MDATGRRGAREFRSTTPVVWPGATAWDELGERPRGRRRRLVREGSSAVSGRSDALAAAGRQPRFRGHGTARGCRSRINAFRPHTGWGCCHGHECASWPARWDAPGTRLLVASRRWHRLAADTVIRIRSCRLSPGFVDRHNPDVANSIVRSMAGQMKKHSPASCSLSWRDPGFLIDPWIHCRGGKQGA